MASDFSIQLADLLPSYPPDGTPGIQTLLTAKKEYSDLASSVTEPVPPRGTYYKHQLLIQRHLRQYDYLMLFHKTGTGKTCAVTAVAEWFKKQYQLGGHIQRVIFLVKGPTLKNEIKNQVICKCTPPSEYEVDTGRSRTGEPLKSGTTKTEFKKWYTVATYGTFASQLRKNYPTPEDDDRLAEDYSGSFIFIDEVHNLHIDPGVDRRKKKENALNKEAIYKQLWRLTHLAQRSKVVIASATPMINDVSEIRP